MAYETYPIPDKQSKLHPIAERLDSQQQQLLPVIGNLYSALDSRVAAQQAALDKVQNKLYRGINGRIKTQATALQSVAAPVMSALGDRISAQGQQIALQSAVLSRLAPHAANPPVPAMQPPPGLRQPSSPFGAGGGAPVSPTFPSLTPGAPAPLFLPPPTSGGPAAGGTGPASPPVLPGAPGQPTTGSTAPQPITPPNWMVLADCAVSNWTILDQNDPAFEHYVANSSYVPLRRDFGADFEGAVAWGRAYHDVNGPYPNLRTDVNPTAVACIAYRTNGKGWPPDGDFGGEGPGVPNAGQPVGDWPFDKSGRYIGS